MLALQYGQCTQQHANRVPPANSVVRPFEVLGEKDMRLVCGRWRKCEQFHCLVVERRDGLVDWKSRQFARQCGGTGESDRRGGSGRILRKVQCVGKARAPMTKVARNDEECVCAREVRRKDAPECFLFLLVNGSY
jgi:hypothetical protein